MAWLQKLQRRSGVRWRVYWRAPAGKPHGKIFSRYRDAIAYGRLMEQWKREGTYFDSGKIELFVTHFGDPAPREYMPVINATREPITVFGLLDYAGQSEVAVMEIPPAGRPTRTGPATTQR
jgi:hypothetical protein